MDAIRYEVARSAERAYESLSMKDMAQIFMIKDQAELDLFIQQNHKKDGVAWEVNADKRVYFSAEKKDKKEIPAVKMINLSLDYATELNRIIWNILKGYV